MADAQIGHHPPADFPLAVRALAAVSRLFAVLEGIGIGICLFSLIGLAVFQFVSRNLRAHHIMFLPAAPDWTDGVIRHSVFLLGFLGAAYATYTGRHIRIDALTRLASPRLRLVLRVVATLAALALLYALIHASLAFLEVAQEESNEASHQEEVFTSARGAMAIVAGFSLIAFHFVIQLLLDLVWVARRTDPPAHWISEASHGGESLDDDSPRSASAVD